MTDNFYTAPNRASNIAPDPDESYIPERPVARHCTLVLPGLLDLPTHEAEAAITQLGRVPELEWFFARAKAQPLSGGSLDAVLFALFDVMSPADKDLPVAPVAYVADANQLAAGWCLRADPVQLVPDRDQLILMGPDSLGLSQAEAEQLASELNAQFAADGWQLEACTPTHWYLHFPAELGLRTYRLADVQGKAISEFLPGGANGKQWQCLMNEVQMVLHTSEVNRGRQFAGRPVVSSVWFWGGGETPQLTHGRWSTVWSNESVSLGLAELSSTPRAALPENAAAWLQTVISPGEHLIVMDDVLRCWQNATVEEWVQKIEWLNREWITPLLSALRKGEMNELTICGCNGEKYVLSRAGLRRWWRRTKPLGEMIVR